MRARRLDELDTHRKIEGLEKIVGLYKGWKPRSRMPSAQ